MWLYCAASHDNATGGHDVASVLLVMIMLLLVNSHDVATVLIVMIMLLLVMMYHVHKHN